MTTQRWALFAAMVPLTLYCGWTLRHQHIGELVALAVLMYLYRLDGKLARQMHRSSRSVQVTID
jgi:phosphatidylglycerophosphate synthase